MHEKAVCQQIIDICLQAKKDYQLSVIDSITLKIGTYSCIHKGQLEYLFSIAKEETELKNTILLFEDDDYKVVCLSCRHIYTPPLNNPLCPNCHSQHFKVISGYDCYVENIEGR